MRLGYNTNGMANHDPLQAIELLAATGYESVALTIDHLLLSPNAADQSAQLQQISECLKRHGMNSVIETGARFLLSPNRKHFPTLLETDPAEAQQRIDFLKYCIDVAVALESGCVSIWSGIKPAGSNFQEAIDILTVNLKTVLEYAEQQGMDIGFEPEPGMLIDTTGRFERLLHMVDSPRLKMTMDIGHLFCLSEVPIAQYIEKWADKIINVHIEDMCAGVHEHLMFGEGQIHFPPVIESLHQIGYDQGVHVELSRHSHNAAEIARQSFEFLSPIIADVKSSNF